MRLSVVCYQIKEEETENQNWEMFGIEDLEHDLSFEFLAYQTEDVGSHVRSFEFLAELFGLLCLGLPGQMNHCK